MNTNTEKKGFLAYLRQTHKKNDRLNPEGVFELVSDTNPDVYNDNETKYFFNDDEKDDGIYYFAWSPSEHTKSVNMTNIYTGKQSQFPFDSKLVHIDLTGKVIDDKYMEHLKTYDALEMVKEENISGGKFKKTIGNKKSTRSKRQTRKGKKVTKLSKTLSKRRMRIRKKSSKKYNK